jgi:hypothetical protein
MRTSIRQFSRDTDIADESSCRYALPTSLTNHHADMHCQTIVDRIAPAEQTLVCEVCIQVSRRFLAANRSARLRLNNPNGRIT